MEIDVLITTKDRTNTINMVLTSLAFQTLKPKRIILFDSGIRSMFYDFAVRHAWDICSRKGIKTLYLRESGLSSLIKARLELFNECKNNFLVLDDDIVLEPTYLKVLNKHLKEYNFARGLLLLPNNEMYKPDYITHRLDEVEQNMLQTHHAFYEYNKPKLIEVDYGNIGGMLIKKEFLEPLIKLYPTINKKGNFEDLIGSHTIGNGLIDTSVIAWHLMSVSQNRMWDTWLNDTLRRKFETNPELIKELLKDE